MSTWPDPKDENLDLAILLAVFGALIWVAYQIYSRLPQ
jgi:hypothetical protein